LEQVLNSKASGGCLASRIACDDIQAYYTIVTQTNPFKQGGVPECHASFSSFFILFLHSLSSFSFFIRFCSLFLFFFSGLVMMDIA
jgi:hypothetical protein